MDQFPHLKFVQKITGRPRLFGGGSSNEKTQRNKINRHTHGTTLSTHTNTIKQEWINSINEREKKGLALLEDNVIPVFLQINPDIINSEFDLQNFGIEIISEVEDGFIIGASMDALQSLEEKIFAVSLVDISRWFWSTNLYIPIKNLYSKIHIFNLIV